MRQIIGGKRYDTETASEIGSTRRWNGQNWSTRWTELYRSPKGNFSPSISRSGKASRLISCH